MNKKYHIGDKEVSKEEFDKEHLSQLQWNICGLIMSIILLRQSVELKTPQDEWMFWLLLILIPIFIVTIKKVWKED